MRATNPRSQQSSKPRQGLSWYLQPAQDAIRAPCAVCHEVELPLFGSRPSLSLNSNVHSAVPDSLIQVILHGVAEPASRDLGYMPAFQDALDDDQIIEFVSYLRKQFAPDKPAWSDLRGEVRRIRSSSK